MFKHFRTYFLLIILLGVQFPLYAINRYFTWVDSESCLRKRIDLDNYDLYNELRTGGWEKEGKIAINPIDLRDLTPSVNNQYFSYDQGKRIRFTLDGTGQVFEYLPLQKNFIELTEPFIADIILGHNISLGKGSSTVLVEQDFGHSVRL